LYLKITPTSWLRSTVSARARNKLHSNLLTQWLSAGNERVFRKVSALKPEVVCSHIALSVVSGQSKHYQNSSGFPVWDSGIPG
jgi:hypothetical protein